MHCADNFFGSNERLPVPSPDPFRFCRRCGAEEDHTWTLVEGLTSTETSTVTGSAAKCDGCGRELNDRVNQLRNAGISEVHCGWCDHGTSAEILRSWKSAPGNEASCLNAGRLLGEMLLSRCEDRFSAESEFFSGNALVPVPGWWARRIKRGFDPALRLAEGISEILGWPVWSPLSRVHGGRMAGKKRPQRRHASRRLFRVHSDSRRKFNMKLNLWVVDDLLASGSTSAAASRLLRQLRPHRIDLVVANVRNETVR